MNESTDRRKTEVVEIIRGDPATDRARGHFDAIRLRTRALPELDFDAMDLSVNFLGKRLSFPLLISSMTGGTDDRLIRINRNLAIAAEMSGVAMAVGSQRVQFTHPTALPSFELRKYAPNALLISNLGAVQLNYGFGLTECQEAVEALGADALYLHLNALQEVIQPEGNRNFSGLAGKIGAVARALPVPVMVKEVGVGMSMADAEPLYRQGVKIFDVAGAGGTSWSRIENHRHPAAQREDVGLKFQDWGLSTPDALRELAPLRAAGATLVASGGIRTGMDMVKAMILGASLSGVARPFLEPALESPEHVVECIRRLKREFAITLFMLGVARAAEVVGRTDLLFHPAAEQ